MLTIKPAYEQLTSFAQAGVNPMDRYLNPGGGAATTTAPKGRRKTAPPGGASTVSPTAIPGGTPPATTGNPAQSGNYQAMISGLMQSAQQFAQTHNAQIQKFNPSIQMIRSVAKSVGTNAASMTPQSAQKVQALTQLLQQATAEEVQGDQFVTKLSTAAQELAAMMGNGATSPIGNKPGNAATTLPAGNAVPAANTTGMPVGNQAPGESTGWADNLWNKMKGGFQRNRAPGSTGMPVGNRGAKSLLTPKMASAETLLQ